MGYSHCLADFKSINLEEMRPAGFLADINRLCEDKQSRVKHGWKQVEQCPVCGSAQRLQEFSKYGIGIFQCLDCTLRYSGKIPNLTEDIYSNAAYLPAAQKSYMENVSYRKERFGKERLELIRIHMGDLKGKKILDVGCGTGWFLETAKEQGMEIFGQELGKELREWTENRIGTDIFSCGIEEIDPDFCFDVITMFDVLEHVPDPLQLVRHSKRLLDEDGILLIFTPNFDSLSIYVMKEHSNLIAPAEHLTYFTKKSVEVLAQKTDMKITYFRTCGIDLGDLKSFYEYNACHELSESCQQLYGCIQPIVDASGAGNHMRFILENRWK
jgi:2-polyprenyl-3-methyl-5-hydroxy-6-metoxy-1,4-benzoquinol methylase